MFWPIKEKKTKEKKTERQVLKTLGITYIWEKKETQKSKNKKKKKRKEKKRKEKEKDGGESLML